MACRIKSQASNLKNMDYVVGPHRSVRKCIVILSTKVLSNDLRRCAEA